MACRTRKKGSLQRVRIYGKYKQLDAKTIRLVHGTSNCLQLRASAEYTCKSVTCSRCVGTAYLSIIRQSAPRECAMPRLVIGKSPLWGALNDEPFFSFSPLLRFLLPFSSPSYASFFILHVFLFSLNPWSILIALWSVMDRPLSAEVSSKI